MREIVCIYHKNCIDGSMSAAIVKTHFKNEKVTLIPLSYDDGNEPAAESLKDKTVVMVDFSLPPNIILEYSKYVEQLVILDHHISAIRNFDNFECPDNVSLLFDIERSGAGLAWDYLFGSIPRFKLVDLIEDRDLWKFKYGNDSKYIHYVLQNLNYDVDKYIEALWWDIDEKIQEGKLLHNFFMNEVDMFVKNVFFIKIGEYEKVPVCNVPFIFASEVAGKLAEIYGPFGATFFLTEDLVVWSLRSKGEMDVSKIAEKYGGGGHKNAAGFRCGYHGLNQLVSL